MFEDQRKQDCRNTLIPDRRSKVEQRQERNTIRKHRDRRWHHRRILYFLTTENREDWSESGRRKIARRRTDSPVMR